MKKVAVCSLLFLGLFTAKPACSAQPFISDDPDIVEKHHAEVYFFSNYNEVDKDTTILPLGAEIDYGLWQEVEIDIVSAYTVVHPDNETNASGVGDSTLELKWRFLNETKQLPEMAFTPTYYIPTGNAKKDLGNGRPSLLLPIWAQKTWDTWTLYGGGGYILLTLLLN